MQEFWYIGYSVFLSLVDATESGQSEIKIDNYSLWLRRFFNYMGWNIGMNFWLMYNLFSSMQFFCSMRSFSSLPLENLEMN